jgi:cobalt-zinc-cadmium efflux system membrane fusion protein
MMTIIDLEKVLIKGYASPEDGSLIKPGDPVEITQKDFQDQKLLSVVTTINPALDPINKSITINVITKSLKQWPRPGQNVRLNITVTTSEPVISVPLSSIEYEGDLATIFVQLDPNTYEKKYIKVRRLTGEAAIVESGLNGNETIAISQVFSLKALSKFEEFGEE